MYGKFPLRWRKLPLRCPTLENRSNRYYRYELIYGLFSILSVTFYETLSILYVWSIHVRNEEEVELGIFFTLTKISILTKILIFEQNFHFLPKFLFLSKISIFYQNFYFRFFPKIFKKFLWYTYKYVYKVAWYAYST